MSSGADNALKHWVFDNMADAAPRLLRFRSGHAAPPTVVAHYGEGGLRLLAAGSDRAFRVFSTIQDQQSRELSQKHVGRKAKKLKVKEADLKLGRVVALDAGTVRERDWCNVITAHEGESAAFVWRLQHFTLGEHELRPPTPAVLPSASGRNATNHTKLEDVTGGRIGAAATAVCLSPCGNFGMVGSASGRLDRYNMQSGLHRGCYGRPHPNPTDIPSSLLPPGQKPLVSAHAGPVVGVAVDSCNRLMVSCGLDKVLRIWDFKAMKVLHEVKLPSTPCRMALHPGSCLVAVASGDTHGITVYDIEANGRLVRRFKGHEDRVTSLQLSADCRWLLSASMDGTLRVWDVPAAQCLQVCMSAPASEQQQQQQQLQQLTGQKRGRAGSGSGVTIAGMAKGECDDEDDSSTDDASSSDDEEGQGRKQKKGDGAAGGAANAGASSGASTSTEAMEAEAEGASSDEDEGYAGAGSSSSSSEEMEEDSIGDGAKDEGSAAARQQRRHPVTGAPEPLAPEMVTLSLLPRAQWQSLVHLEAIKARNKPLQPPKKPEAAPFFLPTTPSLAPNPVFTPLEEQQRQQAQQAQEELEEAAANNVGNAAEELSRVMHTLKSGGGANAKGATPGGVTTFVWLLRAGSDAGDFASFMAHARGLSAAALDREVRALQILALAEEDEMEAAGASSRGNKAKSEGQGANSEALRDVAALLDCLDQQLAAGTDFEFCQALLQLVLQIAVGTDFGFCQALLQLVLQVHGDAIVKQPLLRSTAQRLLGHLKPVWGRLDTLMQDVRCMVGYFGNLQ
ncbi:quinon protein alcohol dehydrogenase-like superfamily [Dunaliella salina]|uniref:Quinon protein alcohol dehydrogenase-like superfamily n=1 Tax=Dunaliella salina TaxID=3046 RepID=A0ABQ7H291_DUNSA|nr:quinon protein alcohol dehydrogenase-like superfamily [Dunaliella salina]|eukprot:KAF5840981.1 quinon protein alcohol dehydrogenase-like superfamily [Dunaliella salina]